MNREWFTLKELSELYTIPIIAVVELKRKLKRRRIYSKDLVILDFHINNINKLYGEVTNSTICDYWREYISKEAKC